MPNLPDDGQARRGQGPTNGLIGSAELDVQGADKSQLAEVESPPCDRIAFASCPPRNRTAHVPPGEKPVRRRPVLQSSPLSPVRFITQESRNTGMFRAFCGK
jgi:hypothetical protein